MQRGRFSPFTFHWTFFSFFRENKDREKMRVWFEQNEKALATMQEASQELLSRGLIVDPQIFQSAVQHQTLHALGEHYLHVSRTAFVKSKKLRINMRLFLFRFGQRTHGGVQQRIHRTSELRKFRGRDASVIQTFLKGYRTFGQSHRIEVSFWT